MSVQVRYSWAPYVGYTQNRMWNSFPRETRTLPNVAQWPGEVRMSKGEIAERVPTKTSNFNTADGLFQGVTDPKPEMPGLRQLNCRCFEFSRVHMIMNRLNRFVRVFQVGKCGSVFWRRNRCLFPKESASNWAGVRPLKYPSCSGGVVEWLTSRTSNLSRISYLASRIGSKPVRNTPLFPLYTHCSVLACSWNGFESVSLSL